MSYVDQSETDRSRLPVTLVAAGDKPSLARSASGAAFVSQLIAARDNLPPQRSRRIGSAERAIGAYRNGARMTERRMPMGYRKTIVA
jgi:hypothetical protein